MKKIRIIALLLAALMLVGAFASCGQVRTSNMTELTQSIASAYNVDEGTAAKLAADVSTSDNSKLEFNEENPGENYFQPAAEENFVDIGDGDVKYVNNQIVLVSEDNVAKSQIEELAASVNASVTGYIEVTGDYQLTLDEAKSIDELNAIVADLEASDLVASAKVSRVIESESTDLGYVPPNDARWANLWSEVPGGENWGIEAIYAPQTWNYIGNMTPVRVGLIDYIFNPYHEDVALASIYNNPDTIDDDHASHVAGIMAGTYNNGVGIAGVYPFGVDRQGNNNIYGASFAGWDTEFEYKSSVAELVLRNVKVINGSFGFTIVYGFKCAIGQDGVSRESAQEYADEVGDFYERLLAKGYDFIIVNAAGNSEDYHFKLENGQWYCVEQEISNGHYMTYDNSITGAQIPDLANYNSVFTMIHNPTVVDRIIVVGSVALDGAFAYSKSYFSSHGSRVDVMAPGSKIWSAALGRSGYVSMSGTSMASPHVAGVAATLWAFDNTLTGARIKKAIVNTASTPVAGTTLGMVNALSALADVAPEKPLGTGVDSSVYGKVSGCVTINGKRWSGATVDAITEDGEFTIPVTTDETGYFEFDLPAGKYTIRVHMNGVDERFEVEIRDGETTFLGDLQIVRTYNTVFSTEYHGGYITDAGATVAGPGIYIDTQHSGFMVPDQTNWDQWITTWPKVMCKNATLSAWGYIIDGQFYIIRYANGARGPYWTHWDADAEFNYVEALYQPNVPTVTIGFDANGGEMIEGIPFAFNEYYIPNGLYYAASISVLPRAEREGYSFRGWWAENSEGTPVFCLSDGTDRNPFGTGNNPASLNSYVNPEFTTFKAWWVPNTYTINFNANGGTNAPASVNGLYDSDITLPSNKPTRRGYTFLGWSADANAAEADFRAGGAYTVKGETTLYAVWAKTEFATYTLTYDANGGANAPASVTAEFDTTVTVTDAVPTREGYTFLGWSTDASAAKAQYKAGAVITIENNLTLYAVWYEGEIAIYTITFDGNGVSDVPAALSGEYEEVVTIPEMTAEREGYSFIGWATSADAETAEYVAGDTIVLDSDLTLYAVWKQGDKIYFSAARYGGVITDPGSGKLEADGRVSFIIEEGQSYSDAVKVWPKAMKEGWTFVAWGLNGEPNRTIYYITTQTPTVDTYSSDDYSDIEVCWAPNTGTNTVTFDPDGGTIIEGLTKYYIGVNQAYSTVMSTTPKVVKEGYSFRGWWYFDETGKALFCITDGTDLNPGGTDLNPRSLDAICNATLTLKPYWVAESFSVVFETNGGNAINPQTVNYGEKIEHVVPTRAGFTFAGWFRDAELTDEFDVENDVITGDTILYAKWTEGEQEHEHVWVLTETVKPTCTAVGKKIYTCSVCGETNVEDIKALGHSFGPWSVVTEAQPGVEGTEQRVCFRCGEVETRAIPALPVEDDELHYEIDNYNFVLYDAAGLNYIRYAEGHYTSNKEIKAAADCVGVNATRIASYTDVDNVMTLPIHKGGIFSMWLRFDDGREFVLTDLDFTRMTQKVVTNGTLDVTVENLYGVRDFYIGRGIHDTFAGVTAAENTIVRIKETKIGTAHSYTYRLQMRQLAADGNYTVCVRYTDTSKEYTYITFHIDVPNPEVVVNGLSATIKNLDDVKVIRVAPGNYTTSHDVKNAAGNRNFTAKSYIRDRDEYTVKFNPEKTGEYTICVEYNGGYQGIFHVTIAKKTTTFKQDGNTVTFGNLDDLYVIRYAMGTYTTSADVKDAAGSKVVRASKINADGEIVISNLAAGTYTFVVQYNEGTYNFFNVTVD